MWTRLTLLVLAVSLAPALWAEEPPTPAYDWGVAYYLSYDNDLERAGPIILKAITEGVKSERQVAAVQADYTDAHGMRRYTITANGCAEARVASEDSADESQLAAYLEWFAQTYPCKHYAVVLLDHGGKLDELCLDEHPGTSGKEWMSGRVLGEKFRALKKRMPGTWDLLFFQQCGRGSLENLYGFRETAAYILCSPPKVGAPNTYYTALHRFLAAAPEADGAGVAKKIAENDRDYSVYLCLRTAKLNELPKRLDAALAPLLAQKALQTAPPPDAIYTDDGESTRDARLYFESLARKNSTGEAELKNFDTWLQNELLEQTWWNAGAPRVKALQKLCKGPSLFVPANAGEASRYKDLDLYRQSALPHLWEALFPAQKATD